MAREFIQLGSEHFDELTALLDRSFGRERGSFEKLLPSLYRPTGERHALQSRDCGGRPARGGAWALPAEMARR